MSSNGAEPAIDVDGLHFAYDRTPVLRDLSLRMRTGEAAAVIGPNGAGKTTLVTCISGLLRPARGSVRLFGRALADMRRREIASVVAAVPQDFQVPFAYRVREVVALGRSPHVGFLGSLQEQDHEVIDRSLLSTDTLDVQGRTFNDLSGGERQRAVIAMALAQQPRLLLLDEPTAHLDIAHQIELLRLVRGISRTRSVTVLACLHDIDLAAAFFPRLLVLHEGRMIADGAPRDVVTRELLADVFGVDADVVFDAPTGPPRVSPRV